MRNLFNLFVLGILMADFTAEAQQCYVIRDSIIAGERATSFSDYIYGANNRLEQVTHTDSGSAVVTTADLVLYTNVTDISEIRTFTTVGQSIVYRTIKYTYSNNKISRVEVMDSSQALWIAAHDIIYNGNEIAAIISDTSARVGTPESIQEASFIDFVWSNGNIASLSLVLGNDTIELVATSDNNENIYKKLLNTEGASFLFQAASLNNLVTVSLVNDEPGIGQMAGTKIVDRIFTYETNGDVETMAENVTPLSSDSRTTRYIYDCNVGIQTPKTPATSISIYPNPAQQVIKIENGIFKGDVRIFDVAGKEVFKGLISEEVSFLDISSLSNGIYSLEMIDGDKLFKGKFLVQQ